MRLFAKFFLCATLVISVALLLSGYLLITASHENALRRETERALNQYQYDKFAVQAALLANEIYADDRISVEGLRRLSSEMNGISTFFAEDKSLLYSGFSGIVDFTVPGSVSGDTIVNQVRTIGEKDYLLVCGKLTQNEVTLYLMTATDISTVVAQKDQMLRSFVNVYFFTLGISMVIVLVLSALITKPINVNFKLFFTKNPFRSLFSLGGLAA